MKKGWLSGRSSIFITAYEDIKKTGLFKSSRYKLVTYSELIEEFQKIGLDIDKDFLEKIDLPYIKKNRKIIEAQKFIIPLENRGGDGPIDFQILMPRYNENPLMTDKGENTPIDIGRTGIFCEFSTLFKDVSFEKNMEEILEDLCSPINQPEEAIEKKVMEWTNKYGLLFSSIYLEAFKLSHDLRSVLYLSDSLLQALQLSYERIPYFMSLNTFLAINDYCLWLFFGSWLFKGEKVREMLKSSESKVRDKLKKIPPKTIKEFNRSEEEIEKAYLLFVQKMRKKGNAEILGFTDDPVVNELMLQWRTLPQVRDLHGIPELIDQLSQWISFSVIVNHKEGIGLETAKYHPNSLFCIMMLEELSFLMNKGSYYKTCENSKCRFGIKDDSKCEKENEVQNKPKRFLSIERRIDARYCSEQCQEEAADQRENERRKLKRKQKML